MNVAVVIGGSAGIGQATSIDLARRGFAVVLTYRSHPEGADETVRAIEQDGGHAVALELDAADTASFGDFAQRVSDTIGTAWGETRVHALVNNAGRSGTALVGEITDDDYEGLHRILLKAPLFLTQALLPLLADGASIVNTTSSSTRPTGATPGYAVYAAMKGGLVVLTHYLARELSTRGIRANSVSPGPTRTRLGGDAFSRFPELIEPQAARTALGRIGEPEDVAAVIAFLASPESGWITGQDIEATGGYDL
ncbi:SDR family NAD(P)-dependent oxidoreductase [Leifsonia virtsii]|uniref:SDR family oxidoreductase n=1 Tax=Leifsonia virtsii TaxID=3035915 RepID=A0ABT8J1T5_9MICO|nr:SDR family oxidoreductase [Leifsonia virtsii]MDN4599049.1 SDR family oxidoreductase [Leifsonia virtsii]